MKNLQCIKNVYSKLYCRYRKIFATPFERAINLYFKEEGELLRTDYPLSRDSLVFDVGGYKGDFSDLIYSKFRCYIYCFEPVKSFYEDIKHRFEGNDKIVIENLALSNRTKLSTIFLEEDGSSLYRDGNSNKETIKEKDISEFLIENNIDNISLLKLNIEGAEYDLLEHMIESKDIEKVKYLQVQFHDVEDDSYSRMQNIWSELSRTHELMWSYRPFVWESWKRKE